MCKKISKMKRVMATLICVSMILSMVGCGKKETKQKASEKKTEIQLFIAASLNQSMQQIVKDYEKKHPNVKVIIHADSSGTLLTQIEEGYECDIFFSAAKKQMDQLEKDKLVENGTRKDILNNQVVLIKGKDEKTKVTSLKNLSKANSMALAASSVPVGKYTREALKSIGSLAADTDASLVTTQQVSKALGSLEISEQANVSKVLIAVAEGSAEVGTVYLSDTYGYEDKVDVIEKVSNKLTGDVIYPACQVVNKDADDTKKQAVKEFYQYMTSRSVKEIYKNHYFDVSLMK